MARYRKNSDEITAPRQRHAARQRGEHVARHLAAFEETYSGMRLKPPQQFCEKPNIDNLRSPLDMAIDLDLIEGDQGVTMNPMMRIGLNWVLLK